MRQEVSEINNGETLLDSFIHIKSPENRFAAKYILYNQVDEELSSTLIAATRKVSEIVSSVSVRIRRSEELSNSLYVMYRSQGDLGATIQAASKVDRLQVSLTSRGCISNRLKINSYTRCFQ